MLDYKKMYFQLAARVADALDILSQAQQEGEAEFMAGERSSEIKVIAIKEEDRDSDE